MTDNYYKQYTKWLQEEFPNAPILSKKAMEELDQSIIDKENEYMQNDRRR